MISPKIEDRLRSVEAICKAAGDALLVLRTISLPVKYEGNQLKTAADMVSDRLICTFLKKKYPHEQIISEESGPRNFKKAEGGRVWIVDPLDGTKSYHNGFDGFCVQTAFAEGGRIKIGVVYWPVKKILYWAIRGRGAFRRASNGEVKRLPFIKHRKPKTYIDNRPARGILVKILRSFGTTNFLECGSYGLKICKVAEGNADVFLKREDYKIWDVAPASLILSEAGGLLTDLKGKEFFYHSGFVSGRGIMGAMKSNYPFFLNKLKHLPELLR